MSLFVSTRVFEVQRGKGVVIVLGEKWWSGWVGAYGCKVFWCCFFVFAKEGFFFEPGDCKIGGLYSLPGLVSIKGL